MQNFKKSSQLLKTGAVKWYIQMIQPTYTIHIFINVGFDNIFLMVATNFQVNREREKATPIWCPEIKFWISYCPKMYLRIHSTFISKEMSEILLLESNLMTELAYPILDANFWIKFWISKNTNPDKAWNWIVGIRIKLYFILNIFLE